MAYRMIKRTPPQNDVSIIEHGKINHPNSDLIIIYSMPFNNTKYDPILGPWQLQRLCT